MAVFVHKGTGRKVSVTGKVADFFRSNGWEEAEGGKPNNTGTGGTTARSTSKRRGKAESN